MRRITKYTLRERPLDERASDFSRLELQPNGSECGGPLDRRAEHPEYLPQHNTK